MVKTKKEARPTQRINQSYMNGLTEGLRWRMDMLEEIRRTTGHLRDEAIEILYKELQSAILETKGGTKTMSELQAANPRSSVNSMPRLCEESCL